MPYRIPFKPSQRPPWDKCGCQWTPEVIDMTGPLEYKYGPYRWTCCWCSKYKVVSTPIAANKQFCPECGHARDLRPGETDKLLIECTNSFGPR